VWELGLGTAGTVLALVALAVRRRSPQRRLAPYLRSSHGRAAAPVPVGWRPAALVVRDGCTLCEQRPADAPVRRGPVG